MCAPNCYCKCCGTCCYFINIIVRWILMDLFLYFGLMITADRCIVGQYWYIILGITMCTIGISCQRLTLWNSCCRRYHVTYSHQSGNVIFYNARYVDPVLRGPDGTLV